MCHEHLDDIEVIDVYRGDSFGVRVEIFPDVFTEDEYNVCVDGLGMMSVWFLFFNLFQSFSFLLTDDTTPQPFILCPHTAA